MGARAASLHRQDSRVQQQCVVAITYILLYAYGNHASSEIMIENTSSTLSEKEKTPRAQRA